MKKRILAWLLLVCMVLGMLPATVGAATYEVPDVFDDELYLDGGPVTISTSGTYLLVGEGTDPVTIKNGSGKVTLVLDSISIESVTSPLYLEDGVDVTLVLKDSSYNVLKCTTVDADQIDANNASGKTAGIRVAVGSKLTIATPTDGTGDGTLVVTGGFGGAGIGGSYLADYDQNESKRSADGKPGANGDNSYNFKTKAMDGPAGGAGGAGGKGGHAGQAGESAGTITIESGVITANGGYGGAGIGGGRGGAGEPGKPGERGSYGEKYQILDEKMSMTVRKNPNNESDYSTQEIQISQVNGPGGTGGSGGGGAGGNGAKGGDGGTVTINGGTVVATGSDGGAGIGGGKGGAGGNGGASVNGIVSEPGQVITQAQVTMPDKVREITFQSRNTPRTGGVYARSGEGAMGKGGSGGDGGTITINGGKVLATGASGVGGGEAGLSGSSSNVTPQTNTHRMPDAYYSASNAPYVQQVVPISWDGYVESYTGFYASEHSLATPQSSSNYSSQDELTLGYYTAYGSYSTNVRYHYNSASTLIREPSNDVQNNNVAGIIFTSSKTMNRNSSQTDYQARTNLNSGLAISFMGNDGLGGEGGHNTSGSNPMKGNDAVVSIKTTVDNVDFKNENGYPSAGRPTDKNDSPLYRFVLKVLNRSTNLPIRDARVSVSVNGGSGASGYVYRTVTDDTGEAILWLPSTSSTTAAVNYPLSGNMVYHDDYGGLSGSYTLQVYPVDAGAQGQSRNTQTVYIGGNLTVKSNHPDGKVYFTEDTEKPVTITVGANSISGNTSGDFFWFREPILSDATKESKYTGYSDFNTAYNNARSANQENAGSITTTTTQKSWTVDINENGHYWFMVNIGSQYKLIDLRVTNIYRRYPIQLREYYSGQEPQEGTGYGPLKTHDSFGNRVDYKGDYGFAWNLNGYEKYLAVADSANGSVVGGFLLPTTAASYDTVQISAANARASMYEAYLVGNRTKQTEIPRNTGKTAYSPVNITLNPAFLGKTYGNCDKINSKLAHNKFSIVYGTAAETSITKVKVTGVIKGTQKQLYENSLMYLGDTTTATISPEHREGYKVVGAEVNGKEKTDYKPDTELSITFEDIHGSTTPANKLETVKFLYESNTVDVTIKAMYGTRLIGSWIKAVEKGTSTTVLAPTIDGYTAIDTDKPYTGTEKELVFHYMKDVGNYTLVAVDEDGTELKRADGSTINKDTVLSSATFNTEENRAKLDPTNYVFSNEPPTFELNGAVLNDGATYDGTGDLLVKFKYAREQRTVTVKAINQQTGEEITLPAGEKTKTGNAGEPLKIDAPTIQGYKVIGDNYRLVPADKTTATFNYEPETVEEATIYVKLYEVDASNQKVGEAFSTNTYVRAVGQEQTFTAPTMTGWVFAESEQNKTKTVTPVKDNDAANTIEFLYKPEYVNVTIKKIVSATGETIGTNETMEARVGQNFKTNAPSVDGYKVATGTATTLEISAADLAVEANRTLTFKYEVVETKPANQYHATVNYHSNLTGINPDPEGRTPGNADSEVFTYTLENPFDAKQPAGWTLMGWSTVKNGAPDADRVWYTNAQKIQLRDGATLKLYAIWHKADGTANSVTMPGKDAAAGTGADDPIVTGNHEVKKDADQGYVTANKQATITLPLAGDKSPYTVSKGTADVYPDGTVVIPEGSEVTDNNGEKITGPATIDPDGNVKQDDKPYVDSNGNIIVPGEDGKTGTKDDVIVKADDQGKPNGTIRDDGKVDVTKPNTTVEIPGKNPGQADSKKNVTVPEGTVVDPNGTITIPDDKTGSLDNKEIPGGAQVAPDGTVTYKYTIKYVYKQANDVEVDLNTANPKKYPTYVMVTENAKETVTAPAIGGYVIENGDHGNPLDTKEITGGTQTNDAAAYEVTFTYKTTSDAENAKKATIQFYPNDGRAETYFDTQVAEPVDGKVTLKQNPFTVAGWTFGGWSNEKDGTQTPENAATYKLYQDRAEVEIAAGKTLKLYAQWYKTDNGKITVPGADAKPGTDANPNGTVDNVTAKPGTTGDLSRDDTNGNVTIPNGGSVEAGGNTIDLPHGGTLKPNGELEIKDANGGTKVIDPSNPTDWEGHYLVTYDSNNSSSAKHFVYEINGKQHKVLDNMFAPDTGKIFGNWRNETRKVVTVGNMISPDANKNTLTLKAEWYEVTEKGEIIMPGNDGETGGVKDKDNITITPDPKMDPNEPLTPDKDGSIKLPTEPGDNGGKVERPTGTVDGKETVIVPPGTKIDPDGTITLPDADNKPLKPGEELPEGIIKITYTSNDPAMEVVEYGTAENGVSVRGGDVFDNVKKTLLGWLDANNTAVAIGDPLKTTTTLTAVWDGEGEITIDQTQNPDVVLDGDTNEYKLVWRGAWANEKTYDLKVLVGGQAPAVGSVKWEIVANSYGDYGFTGSLTAGDILTIDAATGQITVKTSGIVRVKCTAGAHEFFVTVIVPGDVNRDGGIEPDDLTWLVSATDDEIDFTFKRDDRKTWYLLDMADMNKDGSVQPDDCTIVREITDADKVI